MSGTCTAGTSRTTSPGWPQGGQDLTDYLRAELDHYAAATAPLEPLRRRLFTEMVARTPLAEEGPAHTCGAA